VLIDGIPHSSEFAIIGGIILIAVIADEAIRRFTTTTKSLKELPDRRLSPTHPVPNSRCRGILTLWFQRMKNGGIDNQGCAGGFDPSASTRN
jgi:hypothetical protein